jgi:hypothetical protein
MGNVISFTFCIAIWGIFGWALLERPRMLDDAWAGVRRTPLVLKPFLWIAFLPWLGGLAIWESGRGTATARRLAVAVLAAAFVAFWSLLTFAPGGGA